MHDLLIIVKKVKGASLKTYLQSLIGGLAATHRGERGGCRHGRLPTPSVFCLPGRPYRLLTTYICQTHAHPRVVQLLLSFLIGAILHRLQI